MKGIFSLPEGYEPMLSVDLQKNKRLAVLVNALALVIAAVLMVLGIVRRPIEVEIGDPTLFWRLFALAGGYIVYIVLHELVHGVFIRIFSGKRAKYGFTGMYAYAGSDAYFAKYPYLIIALAPVVIWGAVLAALCALVPPAWFWVVYFVQIGNLSGAAGDFYVTLRFLRLPREILVRDYGVGMTVFYKGEKNGNGKI